MQPVPAPQSSAAASTAEELRACLSTLRAIVEDRSVLQALGEAERLALLEAAGRVQHPTRDATARQAKAKRRRENSEKREKDRAAFASTKIRSLRSAPLLAPALALPEGPTPLPPAGRQRLETPRYCYVCKAPFQDLHAFYDAMCPPCGDFNYAKRFQRAPLQGLVALVTGARVKIGFQASLMLLRSGAKVIATTRFPNDAALRYAQESDFEVWKHRLQIHGLDLRHAPSVELFAQYLTRTESRLDILLNNAAQTVRRPPGFYAHLSERERLHQDELPPAARPLLASHHACVRTLDSGETNPQALKASWRSHDASLGIRASAALSQLPYALEQQGDIETLFPSGKLDADQQQVDLRAVNSWRLSLHEVQTAEMLEVHLVNAVAPFILCGKLKPLMLKDRSVSGHIVNVSAMEGSFSRGTKTDKHPHTNMAKAALNMMTLTAAKDYAKSRIWMNAVDTGWVTDEDPALHADRKATELGFQPPLDVVDGAARIVDPVFSAVRDGVELWGHFLKDYKPTSW
ncbi:MAG: SDR family NAD(P)-dependent oxidoreductase [Myxococcaceae bacterium]